MIRPEEYEAYLKGKIEAYEQVLKWYADRQDLQLTLHLKDSLEALEIQLRGLHAAG